MKIEKFAKIKKEYGKFSSFAIWGDDLNDLSVFEKNIKKLHARIIFVGLNASSKLKPLQNFHKSRRGGRDVWLKKYLSRKQFIGAYMTDIFKNSIKIKLTDKFIQKNKEKQMQSLRREVKHITSRHEPVIVSFGRKAFFLLCEFGFKPKFLPHYAGVTRDKFENSVKSLDVRRREIGQ